ncbi:hypothetical protein HAX54_001620, partial [Datura stramonium]|nr:hypothetical protein [Datura stramonium]
MGWVGQRLCQDLKINLHTFTGARPAVAGGYRYFSSSTVGDLPMCPVHWVQAALHQRLTGLNTGGPRNATGISSVERWLPLFRSHLLLLFRDRAALHALALMFCRCR